MEYERTLKLLWKEVQEWISWTIHSRELSLISAAYYVGRYAPQLVTDLKIVKLIDFKTPPEKILRGLEEDALEMIKDKMKVPKYSVFVEYIVPFVPLISHLCYTFLQSKKNAKFLKYCYSASFVNAIVSYVIIFFCNRAVEDGLAEEKALDEYSFYTSNVLYLIIGRLLVVSLLASCLFLELVCSAYNKILQAKLHTD